jgi:hypothetical protein
MPSGKNYVRNYTQEYKTAKARGEKGTGHNGENAERQRVRYAALKRGLVKKGQDWDHIKPLSKHGPNTLSNGRAETPHQNRSFPRRADGSMIANHPKT